MKKIMLVGFLLLAVSAFGNTVVTPDSDGGPYCLSPAFGAAACAITTQYSASGVVFSTPVGTAVFNDPPHAWGGINGLGDVDLLAPVDVTILGTTNFLSVEAGFAADGSLLLTAYDSLGNVIGTRVNGLDGLGPNGRTLMTLSLAGIHSFSVSTPGQDTFGVDQIELGQISNVPEPGSLMLFGSGLVGLAGVVRRKFNL